MLARAIPEIIPVRKQSTQNFRTNLVAQSPESGKLSGRFFGKERGVERENPFYRKKWVFSLHKVYQLFKADSSQSLGKNIFNWEKYI
jgi:hypothetical protein